MHALDLDRRDVLAAAPDHVLAPVDEVEVALGAAAHDVAGVEPAAVPGLLGGPLVLQVVEEEIAPRLGAGGAHQQLARVVDADVDAALVDDSRVDVGRGAAEAALADMARLAVGHDAGGRAGLGHRPGLEQRDAEARLEGGVVARIDAGAEAEAHLVLAVEVARRRREQHRRHDAQVVHHRRAALAHALPPGLRVEAVELDDAAAREDRRHRRERERVHVAERQRRDEAVDVGNDLGEVVQAQVPLAGAQEVAVGEAAALRPAGRARGVEQGALAGAADRLARVARRHRRRRDLAGDLGADRLQLHLGLARRRAQVGLAPRHDDGEAHLAVGDHVDPLGAALVGVDRDDADAQRVQRQPVGEERGPVLEQQADPMAVSVAGLRVGQAQALDLGLDLAPAARAGRDAVGAAGDAVDAEEVGIAAARGDLAERGVDRRHEAGPR